MFYAIKIKMKPYCRYSQNLTEIDSIYLEDSGWYEKEVIHNFLKDNPGEVAVKIWPYPEVVPAVSYKGERYVKSTPNKYGHDNLLALPRE